MLVCLARPGMASAVDEDANEATNRTPYGRRFDPESSSNTTSLDIAGLPTPSRMAHLRQRYSMQGFSQIVTNNPGDCTHTLSLQLSLEKVV